jgi:hypothetical protein
MIWASSEFARSSEALSRPRSCLSSALAVIARPRDPELPAWDEQDGLERSLNLLLDELDQAARR